MQPTDPSITKALKVLREHLTNPDDADMIVRLLQSTGMSSVEVLARVEITIAEMSAAAKHTLTNEAT